MMKTKPSLYFYTALAAFLLCLSEAHAQSGPSGKPQKLDQPERPVQEKKVDKEEAKPNVDDLTKDFKNKADEYQAKQKELIDSLKSAKGEEKDKARAALKALQEDFKDEKDKFRDQVKEAREKISDLKKKLDEEAKEAREKGKPRD